ncbi:MAG TPA: phage tail protein, partial [Burkholderiales bacterium]
SRVGDALFLGDEHAKTFLALFRTLRAEPGASNYAARQLQDQRDHAIHALFDGLAHRATVLVHEADPDELRMIERVAALAAPAHVETRVVAARYPFLVAVASLVGADTYLRESEPARPVQVDRSRLGYVDTLQGLASLDARGGALRQALARPVADAGEDRSVNLSDSFTLDGSRSRPAPGHRVTDFTWSWTPPGAPDQPD